MIPTPTYTYTYGYAYVHIYGPTYIHISANYFVQPKLTYINDAVGGVRDGVFG